MASVQHVEALTPRVVDRTDVSIPTQISVAGRPRPIRLVNVSSHGFMGECPAGVPLRARVSLELPGIGALAASVRWSVGRRVGGRFDTPLNEAQLSEALSDFND